MKPAQILSLGISLWFTSLCQGQVIGSIRHNADPNLHAAAVQAQQRQLSTSAALIPTPLTSQGVPASPVAEVATPEIQDLARGLENDPLRIFNYVHDHIRHVLYFGSKKGAELTLLEKTGNDFDQCALLVALLRSAGYANVGYQFGWMKMPYDSPDHKDLHHWLQLNLINTNWLTTTNYLATFVYGFRGYPAWAANWDTNTFAFQRTWVVLTNGANVYYLDPSFKVSEPFSGINLQAASGFNSNSLMNAAGGSDKGYYVTNISEASVRGTLTGYTTNLLNYIQSNMPNAGVDQVLGGWRIVASTNTALSASPTFPTYDWGGKMPILNWANEPTNIMTKLTITFAGTNWYQCFFPQLQGQRATLTFNTNGLGQLWLEDASVAQAQTVGTGWSAVDLKIDQPIGSWDTNNNVFVDGTAYDQDAPSYYTNWNSTYNIIYGFEPDWGWGWLRKRQNKLAAYRQQGLPDTSRQVVTETMNVMGLNHLNEEWAIERILSAQMGILAQDHNHMGRVVQEPGRGYVFDYTMLGPGDAPSKGVDSVNMNLADRYIAILVYFSSGLEGGVIEQLQASNLVAASTIKMLELAVTNQQAVYLANSTNWTTGVGVKSKLYNYQPYDLGALEYYITNGGTLLVPQNGDNYLTGSTGWNGYGYIVNLGPGSVGSLISDGYSGGAVSDPNATVNPPYVESVDNAQPIFAPFRFYPTGADPVDMASGTFQMKGSDLSLGQREPRGITFAHQYSSLYRFNNPAGMAAGWSHNYMIQAQAVAAPQASLGETTPAQMAPLLAATCAAFGIYNDAQHDPKNWTVMALISKWAEDQLNKRGVSVTLGPQTVLQFVQQPSGTFTPPANCTWSLSQPSNYVLQERHGNTFDFDSLGRATSIVDQYGQALNISYLSGSSYLPKQIVDWKSRQLNFNYTSGQLTSIVDSSNRSVSFGYGNTYSAQGDLLSITDPENKATTFIYDANHQVTSIKNALGQVVVTNLYNDFGRITTQYTQGDTNKLWQIFWSGWQTVVEDPAGNKQRFMYDDQGNQLGFQDALGNLSQDFFDGQNHLTDSISPLNETNLFFYDGKNNMVLTVDPLGFSNQFVFDTQNNLIRSVDARNGTATFGYNSHFQLTGSTNGAGDWVTYSYDTTYGLLNGRTDSAGTTTYGYGGLGQLLSITYPRSLGGEGFLESGLGDVLSHTNGRGFVISYQYNQRRELTNTIAPTNVTSSITRDAVGNVLNTKDARTFTTAFTWSPTRKLLATSFPSTPQGIPVITNAYDYRDWLWRSLNPLTKPTYFTNDAAGRRISVTDPLSRPQTYGYDADARQTASINAGQEAVLQRWDARGLVTRWTDPASNTVQRAYDPAGNQIWLTNRNQQPWQFQFDGANHLTNTISPISHPIGRSWNDRGLLASVQQNSGHTANYFYDARGRQTNRTDLVGSTFYQYDADNNLTSVSENGRTNSWSFDAYDRVSAYQDSDGDLVQYRYDANNNLTNLVYPGNRNVYYFYDSLNRLTNVTDWAQRQTVFSYDLANRMTSITRPNSTVRLINYDDDGEITNIIEKTTANLPICFFTLGWANPGRVAWDFAAPLPQGGVPPNRAMTFNADNSINTFNGQSVGYDLDGNMTSGPLTNNTFITYNYDARNRLASVGGLSYGYDPAGNRIATTNGSTVTRFVVNPNARLPQVLMRMQGSATNYYIYGGGLLYQITETSSATNTLTYHFDLRGSTVALTDASGNITDRIQYSSYGTVTYRAGTTDTPFLYNGRYGVMTDASGLLYMRARFYNPYICRFINPDPSGFAGGLNWYAYAGGNPVMKMDPTGLGSADYQQSFSWLHGSGVPIDPADPFGLINYGPDDWFDRGVDFVNAQLAAYRRAQDARPEWVKQMDEFASFAVLGMAPGIEVLAAESGAIDTSLVRFSQNSISGTFKNGGTVEDLVASLNGSGGEALASQIPPIRLVQQDGLLYTLDNRRLAAFSMTDLQVPYRMATPAEISAEWGSKFTTTAQQGWGQFITVRPPPGFSP